MESARRTRHQRVSTVLSSLSNDDLAGLVSNGTQGEVGIGGLSATFDVDGGRVFAKRIPLTDRELAHPHSTANLFGIPLFCQYGIGQPGFGAWRELAANQLVTEAALAGGAGCFPLLLHWRVLPGRPPIPDEHEEVEAVVAAAGGSAAVRSRLAELASASHSLVLFQEYIPYGLADWLDRDPTGRAPILEQQLTQIVSALQDLRLLHMDGHLLNLRTDGTDIYLADFGLATSPRFDLSEAEKRFAEEHVSHDAAYAAMLLVNWVVKVVIGGPMLGSTRSRNEYVRRCVTDGVPENVPPVAAAIIERHVATAARMNGFYWDVFGGDINVGYPAEEILKML